MKDLLTEKELAEVLGINRKTVYFWRIQGMPFEVDYRFRIHYLYDLSKVKEWAKDNFKKIDEKTF